MSLAPVKVDTQIKDATGKPKSALGQKEVIDVAAGEFFTCALASDGTVACWGEGDNGRLGINSTIDVNYPKAVYTAGVMSGKKSIKLAKAAGAVMCVIAVNADVFSTEINRGNPYCWGLGVGDGTVPASTYTKCSRSVGPTSANTSATSTVYFDALQPVNSAGVINQVGDIEIASTSQISGVGNNNRAYYWGLHGYTKTTVSSGKQTGTGCTYRTEDTGGNSGGNVNPRTGKPCGGGGSGKPGCGGGGGGTTYKTVKRYDVTTTYTPIGSITTLGPLYNGAANQGVLNQKNLRLTSGNAFSGLFCTVPAGSADSYCDAHGTSVNEGQTGSNYTQQCTTVWFTTTCIPAPTGPQQVYSGGWLAGKTVDQLSTGGSGFTCALANNTIGCWGVNTKGQLSTGDILNKNVPTAIKLQ
jgi:hypothetical protein